MNRSPWFFSGLMVTIFAGLAYLVVGLLRPGSMGIEENAGGAGKPLLAEVKKKAEGMQASQERIREKAGEFQGLKGSEGEHRVFVSAQLVYLPENPEPVQPLDPKMVTEDGIQVGWKKEYRFNPADPGVKDEDPDGDGFTNLEEFLAKTDPIQKADSPAKESKLKSRSGESVAMSVSFPEKSGELYTVRFQVGPKRGEFKGKPGDLFWVQAGSAGVEIFSDQAKMSAAQKTAKESGANTHMIPLKIVNYEEKVEKVRDARAGGVEVEVDNSVLVLERMDAVSGHKKLTFSTPQRPQTLIWDVGEIRFFTPASGGVELGPFRIGETFAFEGKEFSLVGREGNKIQLRNLAEPEKEPFWVPPENSGSTTRAVP